MKNELHHGSIQVFHVFRRQTPEDSNSELAELECVEVDIVKYTLSCSCRFFENNWVLCRHILIVMVVIGTCGTTFCQSIPEIYIKSRWSKACRKVAGVSDVAKSSTSYAQRYQDLCGFIVGTGSRICSNQIAYESFIAKLNEAAKEAEKFIQSAAVDSESSCVDCPVAGIFCTIISFDFISLFVNNVTDYVCFFLPVDDQPLPKATKIKDRKNPCRSNARLKPAWENNISKKKQSRRKALNIVPTVSCRDVYLFFK